ncbi:hypothetical protein ACLMJK_002887 [Lecanora helva]
MAYWKIGKDVIDLFTRWSSKPVNIVSGKSIRTRAKKYTTINTRDTAPSTIYAISVEKTHVRGFPHTRYLYGNYKPNQPRFANNEEYLRHWNRFHAPVGHRIRDVDDDGYASDYAK